MKNTVRFMALTLTLVLILSTASFATAQASGNSLEGTWKLTGTIGDSEEFAYAGIGIALLNELGGDISFSFSGGRLLLSVSLFGMSEVQYGTYWTSGEWLLMSGDNSEWVQYDVIGSTLIMKDTDGNSLIFTRK